MPIKIEDRPSICTAKCDFPNCSFTETTEAYPEADDVQKTPNDWWLVTISRIDSPSKTSTLSIPGLQHVYCPVHGQELFRKPPK